VADPFVDWVTPARFPEILDRVARIDADARRTDGHPALGDAVWLDLEHPGPDSAGFFVDDVAYAHVARGDNATPAHWMLGLAVAPAARANNSRGGSPRAALVSAATQHVAKHGGGKVVLWLLGAGPDDDTELAAVGLRPARDLFEMRVALPLDREAKWPEGIRVHTFEPGVDDDAWLEVNNRAFAGHAEQGGWTATTLQRRTAESWFDPTLFLLASDDLGLLGFNWLKVHQAHDPDPRLGEIYVIGIDPRAQGSGLGTALAIAGLETVQQRGIDTGMLFCAADNETALKLYRSLGFTVHRTDRAYECEVGPA
jgi:mycothiol synthase